MFSRSVVGRLARQSALNAFTRYNGTMARARVFQGEIEGELKSLSSGNKYASFKGIPYAKPPIGNLRFQAPLPAEKWEGVFKASEHGSVCPQLDMTSGELLEGSEDCLFLNVYSPDVKGSAPVMVWIHGGGFMSGSGDSGLFGPEFLVEEGVVLVTINYRLEIIGFLCLDTEEVPGNAGMKDQVAALRWVKENISNLGGDPNNITIFGESAGAAAVTYHLVSPMSQGLFHKAIAQSGSIFNEWSTSPKPVERAFRLGKVLGKDAKDTTELLSFLRGLPALDFTKKTLKVMTNDEKMKGLPLHFSPVVEKDFGNEIFLPKPAEVLLRENNFKNIPIMLGFNEKEGLVMLKDCMKKANDINADFQRKIPLRLNQIIPVEKRQEVAAKIKTFYFGDEGISKQTIVEAINLESDYNFIIDIVRFARELVSFYGAPIYFNEFCFDGNFNLMKIGMGFEHAGACHADDIFYLFKAGMEVEEKSDEWKMMKKMTKLWTNFAKYGNPTPKTDDDLITVDWKPVTKQDFNFLSLNSNLTLGQDPVKKRFDFWMDLEKSLLINAKKSHL